MGLATRQRRSPKQTIARRKYNTCSIYEHHMLAYPWGLALHLQRHSTLDIIHIDWAHCRSYSWTEQKTEEEDRKQQEHETTETAAIVNLFAPIQKDTHCLSRRENPTWSSSLKTTCSSLYTVDSFPNHRRLQRSGIKKENLWTGVPPAQVGKI